MERTLQSLLEDLAKDRDKYEHDRSTTLDTKIGLILVFLGLLSGVWWGLAQTSAHSLTQISVRTLWILLVGALLALTISILHLLAVLFGEYRVPGKPAEFKSYSESLKEYYEKVAPGTKDLDERVTNDVAQEIFDALCRSVKQNCATNDNKVRGIQRAKRPIVVAVCFLVLAFGNWLVVKFGT